MSTISKLSQILLSDQITERERIKGVVEIFQALAEKAVSECIAEGQTPRRSLKEIRQDFADAMSRLDEIEAKYVAMLETNKD